MRVPVCLHYTVNTVTLRERYVTCAIIMTYRHQNFPATVFAVLTAKQDELYTQTARISR